MLFGRVKNSVRHKKINLMYMERRNIIISIQQILAIVAMLLCGISVHAADLITQQLTIHIETAGSLPDKIGSERLSLVTNLKLTGEINGTDIKYIRFYGTEITSLDLEELKIVGGGNYYHYDSENVQYDYTSDNTIGQYMFSKMTKLSSIILPSSVTRIEEFAFEKCTSLVSVNIPSSVTSIEESAFYQCTSLSSINIPSGVKSIGGYAFYDCQALNSINIPSSVTSIGGGAFFNCSSLSSISIPSSVTIIDHSTFEGCI